MTGAVEAELPGAGSVRLDVGAQPAFTDVFRRAFGRLMVEWWTADPDALAAAFPADDETARLFG